MQKLTAEFKNRIEKKIDELEAHTSVEFVSVITARSSRYFLWQIIDTFLLYSFLLTTWIFKDHSVSDFRKVIISAGISFAFLLLTFWRPFLRVLLPRHIKRRAVEEKAHIVFLHEEIFQTKDRTGILIFISEFEQGVFILADKGFDKKVASWEWVDLGLTLAKDFSRRSEGETFLLALEQLAKRLSADFPPLADNPNELSNAVREL